MELNKYLRIKTAYIRSPKDILDDPSAARIRDDLGGVLALSNNSNYISPAVIHAAVANALDDPRTKAMYDRNHQRISIGYEGDDNNWGTHRRNDNDIFIDDVRVKPAAPLITLLHEIGHSTYPYVDANGAYYPPYSTMNEKYIEESRANRFAFDRLNSITDKKLRDELSSIAYRDLKPYELTYKLKRTPEFIGKTVARGVPALGIGGIGAALGYYGGDALASKLFKLDKNDWRAKALRWGGMLGLGALGGYGGYKLGKRYENNDKYMLNKDKVMNNVLKLPYYDWKLNKIRKIRSYAEWEYDRNRKRLEDAFVDYQGKKDNYNYNIYNEKDPSLSLMPLIENGKLNYDDMTKALDHYYGFDVKH